MLTVCLRMSVKGRHGAQSDHIWPHGTECRRRSEGDLIPTELEGDCGSNPLKHSDLLGKRRFQATKNCRAQGSEEVERVYQFRQAADLNVEAAGAQEAHPPDGQEHVCAYLFGRVFFLRTRCINPVAPDFHRGVDLKGK